MRRKSFDQMECGIAQSLDILGDPWTLLIMREALFGVQTFDGFYRNLDIPKNTLTDRLNHLVAKDILARDPHPEDGRRLVYSLLPAGEELLTILVALSQWGNKWVFGDRGAPSFVAERDSREAVAEVKVTNGAGKKLTLKDVTMIPGPSASERLKAAFAKLG
ncbi:winged helix-turn-helix transcriptional regulator [Alterisphingorhabdus coralli]|uniref:Helix-turn-helix domain-containing protein n=1 Tax=Alterisphingorhabdus coralli TaxID=3071408 RepID=A0AA97HZT1_9SPHN|nr:helix-turn-helix domain-containing protein [Parasphingorhabdus sp. SCSIO 66989]WOE75064.1 helix-turn-helix domain-containing protein [Parasphingorhabdus sp. SCSIO 66989]